MVDWRGWLKTAAVAATGGALSGGLSAFEDPGRFTLRNGRLETMMLEGAVVAVGALLVRSPFGQTVIGHIRQSREQASADREALAKLAEMLDKKKRP